MARKRSREVDDILSSTDDDFIFSEEDAYSTCDTNATSVDEDQQNSDLADCVADIDATNTDEGEQNSDLADCVADIDATNTDEGEQNSDLADLLADGDNAHPPDYYLQLLGSLAGHDYQGSKYAKRSVALLDGVEEKWYRYIKRSRLLGVS